MRIIDIETRKVRPLDGIEREVYSPHKYGRLKRDIMQNGIKNPLRVTKERKRSKRLSERFLCHVGVHRLKAAKELGLPTVPCIIEDLSPIDALAEGFKDNDMQVSMNPMDQNKMMIVAHAELSFSQIARKFSMSLSKVKKLAQLHKLPFAVQGRIKDGYSWSRAFELLPLKEDDKIVAALDYAIQHNLTEKQIRDYVASGFFDNLEEGKNPKGNPVRCLVCAEMKVYQETRTKNICVPCLKKIGKNPERFKRFVTNR